MQLKFNVNYNVPTTNQLAILIHSKKDTSDFSALIMSNTGEGDWCIQLEQPQDSIEFIYSYAVLSGGTIVEKESGALRLLKMDSRTSRGIVYDNWQNQQPQSYLSTIPFKICAGVEHNIDCQIPDSDALILSTPLPYLPQNLKIAVAGNFTNSIWSVDEALDFQYVGNFTYACVIPRHTIVNDYIEYKFIIKDRYTNQLIDWESGDNRIFKLPKKELFSENIYLNDRPINYNLPNLQLAGSAVPLFSLRSSASWGVGDFSTLKEYVDWSLKTKLKFIQLLPINDTTANRDNGDSYPYSAISSFALHPIYIDPLKVGLLKSKTRIKKYIERAEELNSCAELNYGEVMALKESYLKCMYIQSGNMDLDSIAFKEFMQSNREWLVPYALYSYLRDRFKTTNVKEWGKYAIYNDGLERVIYADIPTSEEEINYYYYVQFHLHIQLKEVRDYAHNKGVFIKGDIPIGVNPQGVDVWQYPKLFNSTMQAGAPPDDFATDGQNWGFPLYNWDIMQQDNYKWWQDRLKSMSQYFDAYRIDHILGFFRIWAIPTDTISGLLGYFVSAKGYTLNELNSNNISVEQRYIMPIISIAHLNKIFTEEDIKVRKEFLTSRGNYTTFKKKYISQQAIIDNAPDWVTPQQLTKVLQLQTEILFVKDRDNTGVYHPRIDAQKSYLFKTLNSDEQEKFNRLYNDYFYHRNNELWRQEALKRLPALISATDMLVCGEDLGMIPATVPDVMDKLGILSLEVERMPKEGNRVVADVNNYNYASVCTTSTHDMAGVRLWWRSNGVIAQHYYNNILNHHGDAPVEATPYICEEILKRHLHTKSMLAILPLQDILAVDETLRRENPKEEWINDPSNRDNYWGYRVHLTVEELKNATDFNNHIKELVELSGR